MEHQSEAPPQGELTGTGANVGEAAPVPSLEPGPSATDSDVFHELPVLEEGLFNLPPSPASYDSAFDPLYKDITNTVKLICEFNKEMAMLTNLIPNNDGEIQDLYTTLLKELISHIEMKKEFDMN